MSVVTAVAPQAPSTSLIRQTVARLVRSADGFECHLTNRGKVLLSSFLGQHVSPGDELSFPLLPASLPAMTEIHVAKVRRPGGPRAVYQAPIAYVTQPRQDKNDDWFVAAEVRGGLGMTSIFLPCQALKEYFYRLPGKPPSTDQRTLYEIARMPSTVSPSELRVGFHLRRLELENESAPHSEHVLLERAFNILGHPDLRACYDAMLSDPDAPAVFPYGGVGSLLVAGERGRDGATFFAQRILGFLPDCHERRFHAPLRKCDFYDDRALYKDARRKLELWIDHAVLHRTWNATWNQWKHMLGTKMEVTATFVESGRYRYRRGEWELSTREVALPSRLEIKLPSDFPQQVEAAKQKYHRFGQYSDALEKVRLRIEHQALERGELDRMLSSLKLPGDFDVAQINWQPDYDPFFYKQLSKLARRTYLFQKEYIFDLERAVVVETPQVGNATYLFSKPRDMESFLKLYVQVSKEDIRRNRNNVAERLGFLGRIVHGRNPRQWIKELKEKAGSLRAV